jgi:hypothetical protein
MSVSLVVVLAKGKTTAPHQSWCSHIVQWCVPENPVEGMPYTKLSSGPRVGLSLLSRIR